MDDDWARFLFLKASSPDHPQTLEAEFWVLERAMRSSRALTNMEAVQSTIRRRKDVHRELKSLAGGRRRSENQQRLSFLMAEGNTRGRQTSKMVRASGQALRRLLMEYRAEICVLEMSSKHGFSSTAQIVAAINPEALRLTSTEAANRFRHELFVEKIASEPRKYLLRANASSSIECMDRIRRGFLEEIVTWPLCLGRLNSRKSESVLGNCELSHKIVAFLSLRDVLSFGVCSRSCVGALERSWLHACLQSLLVAFRQSQVDGKWIESLLMRQLSADEENQLGTLLSSQRALANTIRDWVTYCFPGDPLTLHRDLGIGKSLLVTGQQKHTATHAFPMHTDTLRGASERIHTSTGLFVVRKNLSSREYVPMPSI